ncbi:unnamed protein product, partial [Dovyalis caffra]
MEKQKLRISFLVGFTRTVPLMSQIALPGLGWRALPLIDENFGQAKRRPPVPKVRNADPRYVYYSIQIPSTKVINNIKAAQRYSGR